MSKGRRRKDAELTLIDGAIPDNGAAAPPTMGGFDPCREEPLCLTQKEYSDLQVLEAQMRMQDALVDKFTFQIQLTKIEYDTRIRDMDTRARACRDSKQKLAREYNEKLQGIEQRLGIQMKDYTVREDGSLIMPKPPEGPTS